MSKFGGGGVKCAVCDKTAYPAETIQFEKVPYHVDCFKCFECAKKMEGTSKAAKYEGNIYCTKCFAKNGYAQKQKKVVWVKKETTGEVRKSKFGGGGNPCQICQKTVYAAEALSFEKKIYHPACFKCSMEKCGKKMTASGAAGFEGKLYCTKCFQDNGYNRKQAATSKAGGGSTTTNARASKFGGGGNPCTVCAKTVYPAEQLSFEKNIYHAECFKCKNCGNKMNINSAEGKKQADGSVDIYCKKCWTELSLHLAAKNL